MTTASPASTRKKAPLLIGVAAVLLALAIVVVWRLPRRVAVKAVIPKRVVVLPFENSGAAEDDYFADGLADAVRGKLGSLPGLEVIGRASSTAYKKAAKTPRQIAGGLGVRYFLKATVRWQKGASAAGRVQVSPELLEMAGSGAPVSKWKQTFDADTAGVFQVQSDIARRVAQTLGVALGPAEEKRLAAKPTQNLAAYDAFLRGEEAWKRGLEDSASLQRVLSFYDQAAALDPDFAQAWAQMSVTNSLLCGNRTAGPGVGRRARSAAEKAVALAPGSPEGYSAFGVYRAVVRHDDRGAFEQFTQALRIAPPGADLLRTIARVEQSLGHWEAAAQHLRMAERLDPLATLIKKLFGSTLMYLRRYSQARQVLDRGLALAPADLDLIEFETMTFLGQGDLAGARAVLRAASQRVELAALVAYMANYGDLVWVLDEEQRQLLLNLTPSAFDGNRGFWGLCLAEACAIGGDAAGVRIHAEEASKAFEEQLQAAPQEPQLHASLGLALAYLGRKEEAIREGERAVSLEPVTKNAVDGPYNQHQLVRIYILVDEPEKALDQLKPLLKIPYWVSPAWLKIDPNLDPLRKNPRFQKLAATH